MSKERHESLAAYNRWVNRRIYAATDALSELNYRADRGAYFKSVHGTLNHILLADRSWMVRLTGEGEAATRLDTILYEDRGELRAAREAEDQRIIAYVDGLNDASFASRIAYRSISNPALIEQPLGDVLDHVFNHQTHHRGQVHALITGLIGVAPSLDLLLFQRETGRASVNPVA